MLYGLDKLGFAGYSLEVTSDSVIFYGTTGKILKQTPDKYGYLVVNLESATQSHTQRVHRIVAEVCIENPNPDNYNIVLHGDNNKLNCHPDNLKWGTYRDNNQQCYAQGRNFGNTKSVEHILIIKDAILEGGTYVEIIDRCKSKGVKLSKGTLTKYKKELASECND